MLHDLFATNTFWDLKAEGSSARKTPAGNWKVNLDVEARKFTVDSLGIEADVPMNDWIQIGIFEKVEEQKEEQKILYLKWHRIRSGQQKIFIDLPRKPTHAAIDPNHLLIDLERSDNSKGVNFQPQD